MASIVADASSARQFSVRRRPSRVALAALAFAALGLAEMAAAPTARAQDDELVKVVILSRHGVRSPLVQPTELKTWTASEWPKWTCTGDKPCCPGYLTPEGANLAKQMGNYYRGYKLFPPGSCPTKDDLYFWADTDQRTLATGGALLAGLLEEQCPVAPYLNWHKPAPKAAKKGTAAPALNPCPPPEKDAIFHPVTSGGDCKLDVQRVKNEMSAQIPKLLASISKPLSVAQCKLQCCLDGKCGDEWWRKACGLQQKPPACTLVPKPTGVVASPRDKPTKVQLDGPARIASTFAEIVLLEYANSFPMSEIGFGRTSVDDMIEMFPLHTEAFNVEQWTISIAKPQGSRLLTKILHALEEKSDGKEGSAPPTAKFVAYVGHDTNIANLGAMLELQWEQAPYAKNQTPPASALIFELRRAKGGRKSVYASYAAQLPDKTKPGLVGTPAWPPTALKSYSFDEFRDKVHHARDIEACWK